LPPFPFRSDITGDGKQEVLVHTLVNPVSFYETSITVHDGANGDVLGRFDPPAPRWYLDFKPVVIKDETGDGVDDFLTVAHPPYPGALTLIDSSRLEIYDGASQQHVRSISLERQPSASLEPIAVKLVPNWDGHGSQALLVSCKFRTLTLTVPPNELRLVSLETGATLMQIPVSAGTSSTVPTAWSYAAGINVLPDLNGNGGNEILVGEHYVDVQGVGERVGRIRIFDPAGRRYLYTLPSPVPRAEGGFGLQSALLRRDQPGPLPRLAVSGWTAQVNRAQEGQVVLMELPAFEPSDADGWMLW
jgi:hypothetical protein